MSACLLLAPPCLQSLKLQPLLQSLRLLLRRAVLGSSRRQRATTAG
jgi:hypothetical protein